MAVTTPLSDAKLNAYDYSSPQVLEAQRAANAAGQAGFQQGLQGYQNQSDEKLKALLRGTQNSADLEKLLLLKSTNKIEPGDNVKLGDTNLATTGESKLKKDNDKNQSNALKDVYNKYDTGSKALEDKLDAGTGLLGALKQNDQTSLGQIRSFTLKAMGLNRFNEAEGQAVSPSSYRNMVATALSKAGLPVEGEGALNDQQRAAATKFANTLLDEAQDRHNAIKSQALAGYQTSPYFDENKYKEVSSTLGSPLDSRINKLKSSFDDFHSRAIPNTSAEATPKETPGILGTIKGGLASFLGMGQPAKPATAAPAPALPPPQQPVPSDPINDYLSRMGVK